MHIGTIITELKRPPLRGVLGFFVACFTEEGDDLSQWRGYGGGEGGYSIEFDSVHLRGMSHQEQALLGKIEYDEVKQNAFIDDLLKRTISLFLDGIEKQRAPTREEWASDFLACWSRYAAFFASVIKHPKNSRKNVSGGFYIRSMMNQFRECVICKEARC